jgi:uncharacterized beta-barrel protein YwiB (DUF1934 family)
MPVTRLVFSFSTPTSKGEDILEDKWQVQVRILSQTDTEKSDQSMVGMLYRKPNGWYLRYEEHDALLGDTSTTVKIMSDEIKIIRHGAVDSEMTFAYQQNREGRYQTMNLSMRLETVCRTMDIDVQEGKGRLSWSYDLYLDDTPPNLHRVTIIIS